MDFMYDLINRNLDIVFFIYGFAFVTMGVTVLVQPKKESEFEIANILWILAVFGITHGLNELLDMWAIIKGRHDVLDRIRWFILMTSYMALFEFGRRIFSIKIPEYSHIRQMISSFLKWWLLPVFGTFILVSSLMSSDFWKVGSIWTRYLLGFPGGIMIGIGFNSYYYAEEKILKSLNVKKYFFLAGATFIIYGILGGVVVPKWSFFPASWINTDSFLTTVKIPVQVFRAGCAIISAWALAGMLKIFNWEIRTKLQDAQNVLKKQLRLFEERFMEVVESSSDIIYSIDNSGIIISVNKQGYELLNYLQSEVIGKKIKEICTPDTFKELEKGFEKLKYEGSVFLDEGKIVKKTGEIMDVTAHSVAVYDEKREFYSVRLTFRDITEHKKMQEELRKIEKLESIGIMAGGIAHDFNNILTTITGNISLSIISAGDNKRVSQILADAQKACIHAKHLTNQLLIFSKGGSPVKEVQYIKNILKDSTKFALRGLSVNSELFVSDDLWPVEVDEGQIIQVIHNLVINAQQAMPEGGTIEVIAENVVAGKKDIPLIENRKYVKITVKDNGVGISKELLKKIFDPYFTTKYKGSGLGLTTTYSIIKNHSGYIDVQSETGVGTSFYIYLPASYEKALAKEKKVVTNLQGIGYILLMDDDENVRKCVRNMLNYLGYEVEVAKNGDEAIDLYMKAKESAHPFSAVIMDLTIKGGKGGKETIKELTEIDPEVKAIVSSGYFNDPIMANFKQYGFCGVIPKPYEIEILSSLLDRIINKKS
jgi:PAS domain S-box-containing protein